MARGELTPQEIRTRKTISKNINQLLKETQKKQIDLHRFTNIPKSTITGYVKGTTTPNMGNIQKIADFFGVKKSFIDPRFSGETQNIDELFQIVTHKFELLDKKRQQYVCTVIEEQLYEQQNEKVIHGNFNGKDIDVAGKVAAGLGTQNFDKTQPLFTIRMNKEDIPSDYDLALQVTGNSMEPTFEDGEIIFVKEQNEFQNGMIAAVEINEEAFIKKIYKEESRIRLVSLNRDTDENGDRLYPDFYADEKDELYLIGRVVL